MESMNVLQIVMETALTALDFGPYGSDRVTVQTISPSNTYELKSQMSQLPTDLTFDRVFIIGHGSPQSIGFLKLFDVLWFANLLKKRLSIKAKVVLNSCKTLTHDGQCIAQEFFNRLNLDIFASQEILLLC